MYGSLDSQSFYNTVKHATRSFVKKLYKIKQDIWTEQWDMINYYYSVGVNIVILNVDIDTVIIKNLISFKCF